MEFNGRVVLTARICPILARASVHFNAICEQFTHNTTFEIANAKDLKDSKLSAACSLHAASGSSSSSTSSLRRRRLNEIVEEEEEEERERKRQSVVKEEERPTSSLYSDSGLSPLSSEPPVVLDHQQITNPPETSFASTQNVPDFTGADTPTSPTKSEFDRRLSSQSSRPEVYSSASNNYSYGKPRVKLGPRPSLDAHKRPSTAENFRPVAALPPGLKLFKGTKKSKSQEPEQAEQLDTSPATEPVSDPPQDAANDDQLPPRPTTSSGASVISVTPSVAPAREAKITPEKARLMKAMKLREKRMQGAKSQLSFSTDNKSPTENSADNQADDNKSAVPNADLAELGSSNPQVSAATKLEAHVVETGLYSHPSSPGGASSTGVAESTKASSLSELTDETIQATKQLTLVTGEDNEESMEEVGSPDEKGLQTTKTMIQKDGPVELAQTPEVRGVNTDVSTSEVAKDTQESTEIPVSPQTASQIIEDTVKNSIEADASTPNGDSELAAKGDSNLDVPQIQPVASDLQIPSTDTKSPTSPISPTSLSLKSKFSRTDVAVPTEPTPSTPNKVAVSSSITESEKPKPPPKTSPEILLPPASVSNKSRGTVEPIRTDLPAELSDPLDDDALMDELQTATLQEAKPVLVSKSPITPVFPGSTSPPKELRVPRAASNPLRNSFLMPSDMPQNNTARSISGGAAYLNNLTRQNSNASIQSKKSNVGSTISQRIKALQALSGNQTDDNRPRPATPSSTFFTVRKSNTREASKSPSVVDRAGSLTRQPPTPERNQDATNEVANSGRERSGSVASRLTMFEGQNPPRGRPESIQVTARIVRGSHSPFSKPPSSSGKPGDTPTAEFRQSTLLVDVQRTQSVKAQPLSARVPLEDRPKTSVQDSQEQKSGFESVGKTAKRRTSLSLMKDFIKEHATLSNKSTDNLASSGAKSPSQPPSAHLNSSGYGRRLSTSSRRSSINREGDNASLSGATRSSSRVSESGSADDDKSLSDKKSTNRTSRFMRRLSNSFGGARKTGSASISPTVAEEDADQVEKASKLATQAASPAVVAFMGDVNVQFPDNLLWKRRSMCLDAQGFLFLSTIQGAAKTGKDSAGTKRYHLSDFRKPYVPDVEVQELPNSVVLDFIEGSSLQVACVDRVGQQNILRSKS